MGSVNLDARPNRWQRLAECLLWSSSAALFLALGWQLIQRGIDCQKYYDSQTIWLRIGVAFPTYLGFAIGVGALLRRRPHALSVLLLTAVFSISQWLVLWPQMLTTWVPPLTRGALGYWTTLLPLPILVVWAQLAGHSPLANWWAARPWQFSVRSVLVVMCGVALLARCAVVQRRVEAESSALSAKLMRSGISEQESYEHSRRIVREYPFTLESIWALQTCGNWEFARNRRDTGSEYCRELIRLAVDDWQIDADDDSGVRDLFLRTYIQNVQHWAVRELALYHAEHREWKLAGYYARLGLDRYPYWSDCGTCAEAHAEGYGELVRRIERHEPVLAAQ